MKGEYGGHKQRGSKSEQACEGLEWESHQLDGRGGSSGKEVGGGGRQVA